MSAFGPTVVREAATYRQLSLRNGGAAPMLNTESVFVVDRKTKLAPWFFATPVADEMACDILRGAPDGCFIVRTSRIPDCFILSYSANEWIHHWAIIATVHGVFLKRSRLFFGNLFELLMYYCNNADNSGSLLCRLSVSRTEDFLSQGRRGGSGERERNSHHHHQDSRRETHETWSETGGRSRGQVHSHAHGARRHHHDKHRRVIRRTEYDVVDEPERDRHSERTLMLFDAVPVPDQRPPPPQPLPPPPPPAPAPAQAQERQEQQGNSDYSRTRKNVVETTTTGEPLVKEVTTIEREYVVDDDDSVSSYSTCSACEHHRHTTHHETVEPATAVQSHVHEETMEDGTRVRTIQRQRTITRRRMQDGVQIGPTQTTTYEVIETYEQNLDGTWRLVQSVPAAPQVQTVLPVGALDTTTMSTAQQFEDSRYASQRFDDSRTSIHTSTPLRPSAPLGTSILSQPPVDLQSLSDGRYVYESTIDQQYAPAAVPTAIPVTRAAELRPGGSTVDEEMSRAHQRRVTQRHFVNGQEVGPPVVRTSFSEERMHRDPATGNWVRDNYASQPLSDRPLQSAQPSPAVATNGYAGGGGGGGGAAAAAAAGYGSSMTMGNTSGGGGSRVTFADMPPAAPAPAAGPGSAMPPRFGPAGSSYNLLGQATVPQAYGDV